MEKGDGEAPRAYRVESLARGLRILSMFSEVRLSLRLQEIAEGAGIPVATTFRLVATLEEEGYLERLPDGSLRPTPAVTTLGLAALQGLDLVQASAVALSRLAESTAQTVNLGILAADQVLYLARLKNTDLVTAGVHVGSRLPAVYTSMGKVLLAHLSPPEFRAIVTSASFATPGGPNACSSADSLLDCLPAIREQGWAIQDEELAPGLRSIAAPVLDPDGMAVAAVNIALPAPPWPVSRILEQFRDPLQATCAAISARLLRSFRAIPGHLSVHSGSAGLAACGAPPPGGGK